MSEYRCWDQDEKLGPPPWSKDDPKLIAWEKAHGHDVRLKCYVEFGCQIIEVERDEALAERDRLREALEQIDAVNNDESVGHLSAALQMGQIATAALDKEQGSA